MSFKSGCEWIICMLKWLMWWLALLRWRPFLTIGDPDDFDQMTMTLKCFQMIRIKFIGLMVVKDYLLRNIWCYQADQRLIRVEICRRKGWDWDRFYWTYNRGEFESIDLRWIWCEFRSIQMESYLEMSKTPAAQNSQFFKLGGEFCQVLFKLIVLL
jgi:hypothetical protein